MFAHCGLVVVCLVWVFVGLCCVVGVRLVTVFVDVCVLFVLCDVV